MGPRSGSGRAPSLHDQRIAAVVATLKAHGASSVLDLGCGEGRLLRELLADRSFERIVGLDVSYRSLEWARGRPAAEAHTPLTPRPPTPGMAQQEQDDLLDIEDVVGKRVIATRLMGNVTIGEEHATAALEVLQMETLAELSRADATSNARPLLRATAHRVVDLGDGAATAEATSWWQTMTAADGEGMVVEPVDPRL